MLLKSFELIFKSVAKTIYFVVSLYQIILRMFFKLVTCHDFFVIIFSVSEKISESELSITALFNWNSSSLELLPKNSHKFSSYESKSIHFLISVSDNFLLGYLFDICTLQPATSITTKHVIDKRYNH